VISVREFIDRECKGCISTFAKQKKVDKKTVQEWLAKDAHIINGKVCVPTLHSKPYHST
jgi:hypothetical protein